MFGEVLALWQIGYRYTQDATISGQTRGLFACAQREKYPGYIIKYSTQYSFIFLFYLVCERLQALYGFLFC